MVELGLKIDMCTMDQDFVFFLPVLPSPIRESNVPTQQIQEFGAIHCSHYDGFPFIE